MIPVAQLKPGSPIAEAFASRIFHHNLHPRAPRVVDLDGWALEHYAIAQALAPWVFHLNYRPLKHAPAPRAFRLNRRDPAPGIFHLGHLTISITSPSGRLMRLRALSAG